MSAHHPRSGNSPIDVICFGRVAVDLYAEQIHCDLSQAQTLRKYVGGCAGNIAIGTSRLGLSSLMLSKVGDDQIGEFVCETLQREGVAIDFVSRTSEHLTGLVLLGVCPPDHFPLMFYREQCADMQISLEDLQDVPWAQSKAVVLTGTGLSTTSMRTVTNEVLRHAKQHGLKIIFDLDYRPVLWGQTSKGNGESRYVGAQVVSQEYQPILKHCDLIVGTEEEFLIAAGSATVAQALQRISQETQAILVLKQGAKGCTIYPSIDKPILCIGDKINVLNVLGAGDAFMSGFLRGWLRDEPLEVCARIANAAGAIVVSRHGCAPAMPYWHELEYYFNHDNKKQLLQTAAFHQVHQRSQSTDRQQSALCMLAFDHRIQFETQENQAEKIGAFKALIWQAFKKVLPHNQHSNTRLGILIDPIYGESVLSQACLYAKQHTIEIGMPIEKAGSESLQWLNSSSLYQQILTRPPQAFVKVLCYYHQSSSDQEKENLRLQLSHLQQVCSELERCWMLELITDTIEDGMKWAYGNHLRPTWWKIKAPQSRAEWQKIDAILNHYDPDTRVVILGGASGTLDSLQYEFKCAQSSTKSSGFVVGRTVFWSAWQQYVNGQTSDEKIVEMIAERYQALLTMWFERLPLQKRAGKINDDRKKQEHV